MPDCLVDYINTFAALLTPMIAIIVAYVAYRQYRTARDKLSLDLFEKRLAVYRKVREAVSMINTSGKPSREADLLLLEAKDAATFLFGDDIEKYLAKMWERFSRMTYLQHEMKSSDPEKRKKAIQANADLFKEITEFYYEGPDLFAHYMRMDQAHRSPVRRPKAAT